VDMGMAAKTRPAIVLLAEDINVPRSLIIHIPITRQYRGTDLEVKLGHLHFLEPDSVANVQGIGSLPTVRLEKRLGLLPAAELQTIKQALKKACGL